MKLKQLLISTASIAALAVVPISIVSCGNNNNNAVDGLPPAPGNGDDNNSSKYINVNSRDGIAAYILANSNIASEFIKQVLKRPSYKTVPFSHQWTDKLTSLVYDQNMTITKEGEYTYYNVKSITFTYAAGAVINYQFYENNTLQKGYISTQNEGVITLSVDLHFRSKTDLSAA